ncbi:MAG: sulfite exporter TauE/SafE family protein [Sulfuricella sp.]
MSTTTGIYGALLLGGLLGSLGHCMGMCGPLVMMVGSQMKSRGLAAIPHYLLFHGARIAIYALLGAVVGGIGSLLGLGASLSRLAGGISLVLGTGIILLGTSYLGWLPLGRMEGSGAWLNRAMSQALMRGGRWGVILMGALNGLLPCGLVYSALLVAASSGGALPGALGMFLFGAGTIPALLVIGIGAGALSVRTRQALDRGAGFLIVLFGLQLSLRGATALGIVPSLRLGGLVIW